MNKPVKDIVFSGLEHVKAGELSEITDLYVGCLYTDDLLMELLEKVYSLGYFELVTPSAIPADPAGTEMIIEFTVKEFPRVIRIDFLGNNRIRRGRLMEELDLKKKDTINFEKLRYSEEAIVKKYLEEGFPNVKVSVEIQDNGDSTVTVTFVIEEGEKITVERVYFTGNSSFSLRTLRGQLSMRKGPFQEAKLMADRDAIAQYYANRGFIEASVIDIIRVEYKDGKGNTKMDITFNIYEGSIYTFGGIIFEGNAIFSTESLAELVHSGIGEPVNAARFAADLQRVMDIYNDHGYIFNTFAPEEIRDIENGVFSYKLNIVERGQARIENIIIKGNYSTKPEVILDEIPLRRGDIFSKAKIMEGIRNLYDLQYFSQVIPEVVPGADGLVELTITVEEQPTMDIQFGINVSADSEKDPYLGMIKLSERNFKGGGNGFNAGLEASLLSLNYQSLTLQYNQRRLFGMNLPLGIDLNIEHATTWTVTYDVDFQKDDEDEKYEKYPASIGFSTGYTRQTFLGNFSLNGGVRTGVEYDDINFIPLDPVLRNDDQWTTTNSLWAGVSLDKRDVYYDPAFGYYGVQRVGYNGIFAADREHYIKTDTKVEGFLTLLKIPVSDDYSYKVVFGIHSGLSFIFPQPNRGLSIEMTNQPAVDGMFTGRGWSSAYKNKGRVLFENWAELRFPLVPGILALDFFLDAASVSPSPETFFQGFSAEDMLYSWGAGLRITMSQFPLRFLAAKRFRIQDGEIVRQKGAFFHNAAVPNSGIDLVLSFVLSRY
jgi:outer membrane protein insertion porin family